MQIKKAYTSPKKPLEKDSQTLENMQEEFNFYTYK